MRDCDGNPNFTTLSLHTLKFLSLLGLLASSLFSRYCCETFKRRFTCEDCLCTSVHDQWRYVGNVREVFTNIQCCEDFVEGTRFTAAAIETYSGFWECHLWFGFSSYLSFFVFSLFYSFFYFSGNFVKVLSLILSKNSNFGFIRNCLFAFFLAKRQAMGYFF